MKIAKLVFDCRMINSSGVGRYLRELLPRLLTVWPTATLLGNPDELRYLVDEFRDAKIESFPVPIYSVKEQLFFRKAIKTCDLFWSPHYNVPVLPVRAKRRVVTIHDAFHLAQIKSLPLKQKIYARCMMQRALENSDEVITVSDFSRKEIVRYTKNEYDNKINVIYNGVSRILHNPEHHPALFKDVAYFLFVGNIKPHKNLKNAILGFKSFLINNPALTDIQFVIVGKRHGFITGSEKELRQLLCDEPVVRDKINFTGHISDDELGNLYTAAIALLFPSYYEGFGFPPLEAMALGCPAIVSNQACMPEICGDACLYVDPYKPEDIAEKLMIVHSNREVRTEVVKKGLRQAERYSWDICAQQHIQLFKNIIYS